jgi:hypothetical protein
MHGLPVRELTPHTASNKVGLNVLCLIMPVRYGAIQEYISTIE